MSTLLIARSKRVALAATFLIPFAGAALAQSADNRSTADIEKENAALRAKVHRLEAEKENASLRAKVEQLSGRRPAQAAASEGAPQQLVTRIQTNSPDRTLVMADMPMKAAPMPAAFYSWTGFYLGGNIGYSVGIDRSQTTFNQTSLANPTFNATAADAAVTPAGAIGGVQIGYNWQGGPNWLAGFEADFQGSAQKTTGCVITCLTVPGVEVQTITSTQSLDYFGTVRGRFGFVDRGNLFYVTGGGAYGHVNHSLDFRESQTTAPTFALLNSTITTENKFGWVVGAGVESSLGSNWTAKVEYLYMDLGSIAATVSGTSPNIGPFTLSTTTRLHDNIVRAGLNYRFGPPPGPVSAYDAMAAVPPAVFTWTGFYVGANVGYGFGNDHNQTDIAIPAEFPTALTSAPGNSVTPRGGLGGVQLGYNWQAAPHWLFGFEADLQGTAQTDTVCASATCIIQSQAGGSLNEIITVQHQLDYFGTARGRLGYIYNNTLFYGTGGAAFGHARETVHIDFAGGLTDQTTTKDLTGYAVGGGIEAMLSGAWSVKAEYLFLNLGGISTTATTTLPIVGGTTLQAFSNSTIRDHVVRIGANYHFGAAPY
jgi:outer membrane immunogenic protein